MKQKQVRPSRSQAAQKQPRAHLPSPNTSSKAADQQTPAHVDSPYPVAQRRLSRNASCSMSFRAHFQADQHHPSFPRAPDQSLSSQSPNTAETYNRDMSRPQQSKTRSRSEAIRSTFPTLPALCLSSKRQTTPSAQRCTCTSRPNCRSSTQAIAFL